MEKSINTRKRFVTFLLALVLVLALLTTMHFLVNNLDLLAFLRGLHGG